jgi:hypothetical protein
MSNGSIPKRNATESEDEIEKLHIDSRAPFFNKSNQSTPRVFLHLSFVSLRFFTLLLHEYVLLFAPCARSLWSDFFSSGGEVVSMSAVASFLWYYTHNVDSFSLPFSMIEFAFCFSCCFCYRLRSSLSLLPFSSWPSVQSSTRFGGIFDRSIDRSELKSESGLLGALLGSVWSLGRR